MMVPGGTDVMPQCASFDEGCNKDGVYSVEVDDCEELKSSCQGKAGKPPRNDLPTMRHCISQAMLAGNSELVCKMSLLITIMLCYMIQDVSCCVLLI